ncbi:hypothetical protein D5086_020395 [Populus alba]|uniref:Uncharacterized protein n=1 Tax=Populus alba TaxID=43335 RepID=A0ACC4BKJ7_POPAL
MVSKQSSPRADSLDHRTDLLSLAEAGETVNMMTMEPSWQLSIDKFRLPERRMDSHSGFGCFLKTPRRHKKISEYYRWQEKLLEGFNEVESFVELGISPGSLTEEYSESKSLIGDYLVMVQGIASTFWDLPEDIFN